MNSRNSRAVVRDLPINCADADSGVPDYPVKLMLSQFSSELDGEGDLERFASFLLTTKSARDLVDSILGVIKFNYEANISVNGTTAVAGASNG